MTTHCQKKFNSLLRALRKKLNHNKIFLYDAQPYWKYQDSHDLIFKTEIKYEVNKIGFYWLSEYNLFTEPNEITWSKNVSPNEIFLKDFVQWVHIYEIKRDEISFLNGKGC